MKKGFLAAIILMTCGSLSADAIPIGDFTPEMVDAFGEGQLDGTVIEIAAGTRFPLGICFSGDLIEVESSEESTSLRVLQKIYVKKEGEQFWLSQDNREWKPVAEFVTGTITLGVDNSDGELFAIIDSDLHVR